MELTEVEFWENYWKNCELPCEIDPEFSFERCLSGALMAHLPEVRGDVLEIGCAPGKWLAFMAATFGLKPHGIEYSQAGKQATLRNFELLGLEAGTIRDGDFFSIEPSPIYDVVMSFGFIEHFSDPDMVVQRHLSWLKEDGLLVLGVPNFKGIYSILQRTLDPAILEKHNLEVMSPEYFRHLSTKFALTPLHADYLGSFEPSLPIASPQRRKFPQLLARAFLRLTHMLRLPWMDRINHPWLSSYLLAIYRKSTRN